MNFFFCYYKILWEYYLACTYLGQFNVCSQAMISAFWPQNKPSLILFEVRPVFLIGMLNIISLFEWLVFSFGWKTQRDPHSDKRPLIFTDWIHNLLLTKNSLILCHQCMECTSSPCPYVILTVKTKSNHIQGAMMSPGTNCHPSVFYMEKSQAIRKIFLENAILVTNKTCRL